MPYKITVDTMNELRDIHNAIDTSAVASDHMLFAVGSILTLKTSEVTDALSFWDNLTDSEREALIYWLDEQLQQHRTLDNAKDALNRYMGLYRTFEHYAHSFLVDTGYTDDLPDIIAHNINWENVAHDMSYDYETVEHANGVLIFST